jgi:hypothetical protein
MDVKQGIATLVVAPLYNFFEKFVWHVTHATGHLQTQRNVQPLILSASMHLVVPLVSHTTTPPPPRHMPTPPCRTAPGQ